MESMSGEKLAYIGDLNPKKQQVPEVMERHGIIILTGLSAPMAVLFLDIMVYGKLVLVASY
ncbi:hypothetical protein D3C77_660310 [compost metagenome]